MNHDMKCEICGGTVREFDRTRIMGKYDVSYFRCNECGFIQTEKPYWLDEAYSSAIADSDIGILQRNISISRLTSALFKVCFKESQHFLDWGGGYGIYVRLMRDKGFSFEWYDKYCENLFACGQERKRDHYDIITSFEMMEHEYEPLKLLKEVFQTGNTFVFTTELNSYSNPRKVADWWYYCTDHGQHVSLYTKKSLEYLARKFKKNYYQCGMLHILTEKNLTQSRLKLIARKPLLFDKLIKKASLLETDYQNITGIEI